MLPRLESLLAKTFKIAIKSKGNILFVDPAQIAFVEAQGNHVLFKGPSESHRLRESISGVARKLEPCGFIRIHRSILVNTSFVEGIRSRANNDGGTCALYQRGNRADCFTQLQKEFEIHSSILGRNERGLAG